MKKKTSIREQREQQLQKAKSAFQQSEAKRNEVLKAEKTAQEAAAREKEVKRKQAEYEEKKRELEKTLNHVRERTLSTEKKSTAKAAGLKSTFTLGGEELLMTSFGKGNAAIPEKKIANGAIESIAEKPAFSVQPDRIYFQIDGRVKNASTDNPLYHAETPATNRREDLLHARDKLEKLYYGANFEDNIHIQAIYSILDIEKILSIHINNIVYMLNNFLREENRNDMMDLIGYMHGEDETYEKFLQKQDPEIIQAFKRLCRARQLGYLSLQVMPAEPPLDKDGKPVRIKKDLNAIQLTEEEFFYMLSAISTMRHMLAHGSPKQNIYEVEGFGKGNAISRVLDRLYADRIRELNNGFIKKAGKNLAILFKAFSVTNKEKKAAYARDYYDFTVRKQYKNTGFSIKILREHMTTDILDAMVLRDKKYDTVRGKLYPFADFAIYRYYAERPEEAESLVNSLRASFSEKEKDEFYRREAERIWPQKQVGDLILHHILPEMSGETIKNLTPDPDVTDIMLKDVLVKPDATDFSKMIYMISMFIDGKEINDLLTTLIHQFENIAAFTSVMKDQGLQTEFAEDFKLFGRSATVAAELRTINSFARMSKESANAKEIMFVEAFKVLGMKVDNEEKLIQEVREILDPEKSGAGTQRRGIRNFIANNVIESTRFKYLIRYGNVNKLKELSRSRVLVSFVLKEIPDDQVIRYYAAIGEERFSDPAEIRNVLTDRLTGFSFEELRDVRQNDRKANREEQAEKMHKQALVRLYLTVLYLALKNLVYINSRYFLAFHCVERDRMLLNPDYWKKANDKQYRFVPEYQFKVFAREFLDQYPPRPRVKAYLDQNFAHSDDWTIRAFRNKVEHLDAIRNADMYIKDVKEIHSWYELYHYLLQRRIIDQYDYDSTHESKAAGKMIISAEELNPQTLMYFDLVKKYGSCCKDFIKALNVPFAYNLARYKNLSIDGLFDKNRPGQKGCGKLESSGKNGQE